MGFAHEVCAAEALDATVDAIVATLVDNGPMATRACKALVHDVAGREITAELRAETARRIADIRASDEGKEGVQSFLDKRKPAWLIAACRSSSETWPGCSLACAASLTNSAIDSRTEGSCARIRNRVRSRSASPPGLARSSSLLPRIRHPDALQDPRLAHLHPPRLADAQMVLALQMQRPMHHQMRQVIRQRPTRPPLPRAAAPQTPARYRRPHPPRPARRSARWWLCRSPDARGSAPAPPDRNSASPFPLRPPRPPRALPPAQHREPPPPGWIIENDIDTRSTAPVIRRPGDRSGMVSRVAHQPRSARPGSAPAASRLPPHPAAHTHRRSAPPADDAPRRACRTAPRQSP